MDFYLKHDMKRPKFPNMADKIPCNQEVPDPITGRTPSQQREWESDQRLKNNPLFQRKEYPNNRKKEDRNK